jgi:hypothetical protein
MRHIQTKKVFYYIALLFVLSCSAEKPADVSTKNLRGADTTTASGQYQSVSTALSESYLVEISPINASRNTTVQVIAHGFKLSNAKIEWLLNGHPTMSNSASQFNAKETQKGDKIQVKAIIQGKILMSNIIEIKNAPPEIKRVKILPEIFKSGDTLSVDVSGNDADSDEVTITYEWTKNGEPAGKGKQLEVPIKRGDKITVRITPFDGEVNGSAVVLNREIKNMPPMIMEDNTFHLDGKIYTCQIKATDPDADTLSYALKQAPEGMIIDKTGLITWQLSKKDENKYLVTVQVTDGQGGEASYTFNISPGFQ